MPTLAGPFAFAQGVAQALLPALFVLNCFGSAQPRVAALLRKLTHYRCPPGGRATKRGAASSAPTTKNETAGGPPHRAGRALQGPRRSKRRHPEGSGRRTPKEAAPRHSLLAQQRFDLAAQHRQLGFDHGPDQPVVHVRVAVDEDVAERDDPTLLADARGKFFIPPGKPRQGRANNLELLLHGGAQHRVVVVIRKLLACGKIYKASHRLLHVVQVFFASSSI